MKRRDLKQGLVRINKHKAGGDYDHYFATIPAKLARLIDPEQVFKVELVEEGILLRLYEETPEATLPAWVKGEQ